MARIEQEVVEEEQKQRQEAEMKKAQIESAERKRREGPVDDSQMVDEMFGFIDAQTDSSGDGTGPSAFKVSLELDALVLPSICFIIDEFYVVYSQVKFVLIM